MSCKSYINWLWKSHDWEATLSTLNIDVKVNHIQVQHLNPSYSNPKIDKNTHTKVALSKALYRPNRMTPMPFDCIKKMYSEMGYKKGTVWHKVLEEKAGFAYCTLLGEIMYSYMTCHLDVGYAVTTCLKLASTPSKYHYKLLKYLPQYLHA